MSFSELYKFIGDLLEAKQLPAFLCGVVLGGIVIALFMKFMHKWIAFAWVKDLRTQIAALTNARRNAEEANERLRNENQSISRERSLLHDKTKIQDGQIAALDQKVRELSTECENRATQLIDVGNKLKHEKKGRLALKKQVDALIKQLEEVDNSDGKIWDKKATGIAKPFVPLSMRRTAIISLVNLKGGVGKTTITANIGATLASEGLRVLLIDIDHQSSLTNLCLNREENDEVIRSGRYIDGFLEEGGDFAAFRRCVTRLQEPVGAGQLHLAAVRETFVDVETKLQARWVVGQLDEDVRFRLRGGLHSHKLRDFYDVVLIDCPPRWSTGCVNALAASDYVLIPVLLEAISAEAVPRILAWIKNFQRVCNPDLNILGLVGNKASNRDPLVSRERIVWKELSDRSEKVWKSPVHLFNEIIREHPEVRGTFAALDPKHRPRYTNLVHQIRQVIPHAHLEPSAVSPLAGTTAGGGGH